MGCIYRKKRYDISTKWKAINNICFVFFCIMINITFFVTLLGYFDITMRIMIMKKKYLKIMRELHPLVLFAFTAPNKLYRIYWKNCI